MMVKNSMKLNCFNFHSPLYESRSLEKRDEKQQHHRQARFHLRLYVKCNPASDLFSAFLETRLGYMNMQFGMFRRARRSENRMENSSMKLQLKIDRKSLLGRQKMMDVLAQLSW